MAQTNYRTINIDALDLDSPANFDLSTLTPSVKPISTEEVQTNVNQIRQILRSGDSEGALRSALEAAPYGADARGKVRIHLHLWAWRSGWLEWSWRLEIRSLPMQSPHRSQGHDSFESCLNHCPKFDRLSRSSANAIESGPTHRPPHRDPPIHPRLGNDASPPKIPRRTRRHRNVGCVDEILVGPL